MKRWAVLSFLLLLFAFSANGQKTGTKGLVLTGTIIDLGVTSECQGKDGRTLVEVTLSMVLRNDSNRQVVTVKPRIFSPSVIEDLGKTRVKFLSALPSLTDKENENVQTVSIRKDNCRLPPYTFSGRNDPVSSLIENIDLPGPNSTYFVAIAPGSYHEFVETLRLDVGYEVDVTLGRPIGEARIRSEFPAFQIEYHLSLKENQKGEGLFRTLQTRWKNYGDLFLDDNGDFTVTSEPIINRTTG